MMLLRCRSKAHTDFEKDFTHTNNHLTRKRLISRLNILTHLFRGFWTNSYQTLRAEDA